jgi:hypothetical protein
MTGYVRNTFQAQTPIGQAMQNIAQSMFQARAMQQQQALQQQEMAMKQAEFDARMPLLQAQAEAQQASAAKDRMAVDETSANMARAKAMPDNFAMSAANLTRPQMNVLRGYQQTEKWGPDTQYSQDMHPDETTPIAGLFNLAPRPGFATPQVMDNVNQADMMTGMMGVGQKADDITKAMQMLSDMNFIQSNPDAAAAQTRGRATAATGGKALFGNPTSDGLIGDLFTGAILNTSNPMALSEMGKDKAYSANQYAHANQANAAAALNRANIGKVNAQTQNERAGNTPSAKGGLTEAQRMEINRKNEEITSARMMIKAFKDNGGLLADKVDDPEFQKIAALAMQKWSGVPDPRQNDWIGYLAGQGYETGQGYTKAGQKPAAQKPAAASGNTKQPALGEVRKGYRFRGGDPSDKGSWEYVGGA